MKLFPNKTCIAPGFTLVEVLVTCGILAILIAILLPSLSGIRRSALTAKCMANHRQITSAYLLYLNDNDGRLWYRPPGGSASWTNGSGALFGSQAIGNVGYLCTLLEPYGLARAAWNNWKPIANRANTVWYCPAAVNAKGLEGHGATYFYQFLGSADGARLPSIAGIISTKPFLNDYYGNHLEPNSAIPQKQYAPTPKMYSYLDGHSEYR